VRLLELLQQAQSRGAQLQLAPGQAPGLAYLGRLEILEGPRLTPSSLEALLNEARSWGLSGGDGQHRLGIPGLGRAWAWRCGEQVTFSSELPAERLELAELGLPAELLKLDAPGLYVLSGPRRSGLSTSLAALLQEAQKEPQRLTLLSRGGDRLLGSSSGFFGLREFPQDFQDWSAALQLAAQSSDLIALPAACPEALRGALRLAEEGLRVLLEVNADCLLTALERIAEHAPPRWLRSLRWGLCQMLLPEDPCLLLSEFADGPGCQVLLSEGYGKGFAKREGCWTFRDSLASLNR
jgi:hypothetical protein